MTATVLMIHGLCGGGEVWTRFAHSLRGAGWRVETPTIFEKQRQRATDAPSSSLASLTLADYVEDMARVARRLEAETGQRPVVFGHSLGGLIAQKLAEQQLSRATVLITPMAPADIINRSNVPFKAALACAFTLANILFKPGWKNRAVKIWERGFKWGMLNGIAPGRRDAIYATARFCSGLAFWDTFQPAKSAPRINSVDAARITTPILTIGAVKDRLTSVHLHRAIAKRYATRGGDYLELPNNAHWVLDEPNADDVLGEIHTWLRAKVPRPS